jgi:uncharacterized protein YbbC (DUF1343 family)/CubicO group peptidase (beta-lactamase class C family)
MVKAAAAAALLAVLCLTGTAQQRLDTSPRPAAGSPLAAEPAPAPDPAPFAAIDEVVEQAIAEKRTPGAVVLIGRGDRVLYQKAYGHRAIVPNPEPMTLDTVFDLASLTKVVATAPSVMMLLEQGRIRLNDRVATYIPGFERYGKGDITIRHLLTHMSGLRPDLDLAEAWSGSDTAIALAMEEVPTSPPGTRFVYSDINFFLLGDIVRRVSGETLDRFAAERIFAPLGMKDTMFLPPESLRPRIAPTQPCAPLEWPCEGTDAQMLRGVVHDPTARRMGGVAGHAGLFSTAADLSIFCRMLLSGGAYRGTRVLSPLAVLKMTTAAGDDGRSLRGLGWDIDSGYSSNRGELLPVGSFGHTGFTGTSVWLDPATGLYVVFLSNRVHPDGLGDVTPLRAKVATIAASTVPAPPGAASMTWTGRDFGPAGTLPAPVREPVLSGLDVLRAEGFARLRGKRVGLVTNHTGRARDGATAIDLLHDAPGVNLVALFAPEHGIRGVLDEKVPADTDAKTGLPIHSLYGDSRRPDVDLLRTLDVIVIDLQDVGARFYTYSTTTAYVLEAAASAGVPVMVLDRPNPIDGYSIEGPGLDPGQASFTGYFPGMPIRHGLTLGELARLYNGENHIGADLTVVTMKNWRRDAFFDQTGLPWINPSPNMRNLVEATLYPGIGAIEGTNLSVGRGTDTPFEQVGAPWIDGVALADALNARGLSGISFYPVRFTPTASKYAGQECQGVFMVVTDRQALRAVRVGIEIAATIRRLYGSRFEIDAAERLLGSRETITRIRAGEDPAAIEASWASAVAHWRLQRAPYLLYR